MRNTPSRERKTVRRAAWASLVGGTVEFYDYFIFGTASAFVFGHVFFPRISPLMGTLAAFATFGIGFLARPAGAVFFGRIGDRMGRKRVLVLTLLLMGGGTFLIGLLPTAAQVGLLAPILLVLLRLVQGFGIGGEWGGAALIAVEHAPADKRGRYGTFAQMGVALGIVLSSGTFALLQRLTTDEQFITWGWRIPFLISGVLVLVGFWIRRTVTETPEFQRLKQEGVSEAPVTETLRDHRRGVWTAVGLKISEGVFGYLSLTFAITYIAQTVDPGADYASLAVAISGMGSCVLYYLSGRASDKFGRRPVYLAGGLFAIAFAYPFYLMLDTGSLVVTSIALILCLGVAAGIQFGVQPAYFAELFGARIRLTGMSLGYQSGNIIGAGFAPFIATALLALGNGSPHWVVLYMILTASVTVAVTLTAPDPYGASLKQRAAESEAATVPA